PRPTKLLHLTGDKNRDTLPNILGGAGVYLASLKVYETQGSFNFLWHLKDIVLESAVVGRILCTVGCRICLRHSCARL
ncbi:hypothetical protein EV421DRAFT_2082543, partial [Armillaria borealis]